MDTMGRYIYGVIGSGRAESFSLEGVVPLAEDRAPDDEQAERAYTVNWRDLSAVVTKAPVVDYAALPKDSLAHVLVRHQQVIEKVMVRHTILPMRLGTCTADDEQVRQILARGYETIHDTLQQAQAVVEIDVTATIGDFRSFLRRISEIPEVLRLKKTLLQSPSNVTVEDQMKIGMLVKRHADQQKEQMAQQIRSVLGVMAEEAKAHDLMDDKMVLNAAFLLRRNWQQAFDRQVEQLNARFDNQLDFRCVGPLPPYSFYTLEVKVTDVEELNWARRQLGLYDSSVTAEAIKKAHRQAALTCHPDKNPGVPGIEQKFTDMSRAYKILLDHCRTSGRREHEDGSPDAGPTSEKNAILVTTMR